MAGADVNSQDYHGWTALMKAAYGGHAQIALRLLEAGADPTKDHDGWTAKEVADDNGHGAVAHIILEWSQSH
jgi:ankyrin repeat protein